MDISYGIEQIEIIYHGKPITITKSCDSIGETTWDVSYKGCAVGFHELPTIKEAVLYASGVNSGIIRYNPNIRGREYE